jgi:hypothetical protein
MYGPIIAGCVACVGALLYQQRSSTPKKRKALPGKTGRGPASTPPRDRGVDAEFSDLPPSVEFAIPFDTDRIDRWAWDLYKRGARGDTLIVETLNSAYPVTNFGDPIVWPTREPQLRRFQSQVRDRVYRLEREWNRL